MSNTNWDDFKGLDGEEYNNPQDIEDAIQKILKDFGKSKPARQVFPEPEKPLVDPSFDFDWYIELEEWIYNTLLRFLVTRGYEPVDKQGMKDSVVDAYSYPLPSDVWDDLTLFCGLSLKTTVMQVHLKQHPQVLHVFAYNLDLRPFWGINRFYRLVPDSVDTPKP